MFGDNVKAIREQLGITQYQLAEILGVSRSNIGNWEQTSAEPEYAMLVKLKKALNCTYEELLEGD